MPVATTHKVKKKNVAYWTAEWSSSVFYDFSKNPPVTPSVPTVSIDNYKLTAKVNDYNDTNDSIEFYVVKNDSTKFTSGVAKKVTNHAEFSCNVAAGNTYKVRCRGKQGNRYSAWSEYSDGVETIPNAVSKITECKALSETSIRLEWDAVGNANSYNVEYTSDRDWFDSSNQTQSLSVKTNHCEITGLETGKTWFIRIQAVNSVGESGWCEPVSIVIGKAPSAPTTWSSTTTAMVGESVSLYWVHNSEDNSSQTVAELELTIDGKSKVLTIQNSTDDEEKDKTSVYLLSTDDYKEGTEVLWRVRTKGILEKYSEWSIQRRIDVNAQPTLSISFIDGSGNQIDTMVSSFPLKIFGHGEPYPQKIISCMISVIANEPYETIDHTGEETTIAKNETIYSKYIDSGEGTFEIVLEDDLVLENSFEFVLNPGDITLVNNVSYTLECVITMDSGLSARAVKDFNVGWSDDEFEPDAEIGIDMDSYSAYIKPYCVYDDGTYVEDVILSVYRRDFDGRLTELASGLENNSVYITDPHPSLNYARYRIVAISKITGSVGYYDPPGVPVEGDAIIIQWDETWTLFDEIEETDEQPWTGSLLRLPYNIDIQEKGNRDIALVEYIGRNHPVGYYGTQLGYTATWNVEVPVTDEETLYALRRLMNWMDDVYVREPSGTGYWANVEVSFSKKHCELTIPVTLDITRVEGGV